MLVAETCPTYDSVDRAHGRPGADDATDGYSTSP